MQSVRDHLETILARLAARAGDERVFTKLYAEAARAAADASDARKRAGVKLGPLDGTIFSMKDLFDVAGEPTTAGSLMLKTAAPALRDATIVSRLRQAGAVIIGKTNMTEFAFTAIGDNQHYGTPGNAMDARRIPGGSSSGAGVSVGEGTCDIAIGSDTGGSVRIPASLNGVVGFKPTARRVPLTGAYPLSATLDSIGPLALSVAACALADAAMSGENLPPLHLSLPLAGLRVGIPRGLLFEDTESEISAAFDRGLANIEQTGARLTDLSIEDLLADLRAATRRGSIAAMEGAEIHADWLATRASAPVDPWVSGPLSRAAAIPAPVYIRAMRRRVTLCAAMDERLASVDVLALPTTPVTAPTIVSMADADLRERTEGLLLRNTQVANQFDLCAISLPMPGMTLQAGLMLVARNGHDQHLLRIAAEVERLLGP